MPFDEPHPIWPEGPDCDEQCPGKWSQYHDGFAWGVEKERARIRAAVEGLEATQYYRSEDKMCPNCVTPWKCNGPHIPPFSEPAGYEVDRAAVLAIIDADAP